MSTTFKQQIDISKLTICELNTPDFDYWSRMEAVEVIILLVSSTFHKVAPFVYVHDQFIHRNKGIFGIDISSIPDEWGETRKKAKIWLNGRNYTSNRSFRDIIKIHSIPEKENPYEYISNGLACWVEQALAHARAGY